MRKPEIGKPKQPATVVMTRMRGKARIEGEWVVLDPESAEEYAPALENFTPPSSSIHKGVTSQEPKLVFELASLPLPLQPADVRLFTYRYGLLWHGSASEPMREKFRLWEPEIEHLRMTIDIYYKLHQAMPGDAAAIDDLQQTVKKLGPVPQLSSGQLSTDCSSTNQATGELFDTAGAWLARRISEGLDGINIRMVAFADLESFNEPLPSPYIRRSALPDSSVPVSRPAKAPADPTRPGRPRGRRSVGASYRPSDLFCFDVQSEGLSGLAYFQLARIIEARQPLARCVECGGFFVFTHKTRQFCSTRCGNREHSRRFAERRKQGLQQ